MIEKKSEKYLMIITLLLVFGLGGTWMYRTYGENLSVFASDMESLDTKIKSLLAIQEKGVQIQSKYEAMTKELTLEGTDSQQSNQIYQEIINMLKEVGLTNKYKRVNTKEPIYEDDFKIISIAIDQIECTPAQLGNLFYLLEKNSKVMEIESCDIINNIDNYGVPRARGMTISNSAYQSGLLSVNMQISRLIDYKKGEKPERR